MTGILGDGSWGLPSHQSGVGRRNGNNGCLAIIGMVLTDAFVQRQEVKDLASTNQVPEFKS